MTDQEQAAYRELSDRLTAMAALATAVACRWQDADGRPIGDERTFRARLLHQLGDFLSWAGLLPRCHPSTTSEPRGSLPASR